MPESRVEAFERFKRVLADGGSPVVLFNIAWSAGYNAMSELPACGICGQESCAPVHMVKSGHDFTMRDTHDSGRIES